MEQGLIEVSIFHQPLMLAPLQGQLLLRLPEDRRGLEIMVWRLGVLVLL